MENRGEICLEEEVWRMWRMGMRPEEIAGEMGVDLTWVEQVIEMFPDEGASGEDGG